MAEQHFGKSYGGDIAANYERYFVPAIGAPVAADLMRTAALRSGERVLDVACGTGVVARLAAEQVGPTGAVTGLDVNPGMLAVARSATPPGTTIEWQEASAEKMPFPDSSFDVVLCQMGLQFMPDRSAALREMYRTLKPGGRLILSVPGPIPRAMEIMAEGLARHVGAETAGFVKHIFSLHDTAEIQDLLSEAGFRDVSVESDTRRLRLPAPEIFLWENVHSTPVAAGIAGLNEEARRELENDVVPKWQEFVEGGSLVLTLRMVVARATKQ